MTDLGIHLTGINKIIFDKLNRTSDKQLMDLLTSPENKPHLHDWRNWGKNEQKMMAYIAHQRGLIN